MELALAYNDAKKGGYSEKKHFVEYLYCNGPELDADTICYYREKAYQDLIYIQIAEIEFNDMTIVDNLRVPKYGKSNDLADCFTKPCNYLGPFSNTIGLMGDSNNFRTMPNIFTTLLHGSEEDKKDLKACWGNIREHLMSKMLPNIQTAYQVLYNGMYDHMKDFIEQCKTAGITDGIKLGDPYAIGRADNIAAATKINIHNQLGDCARVWEHMRRFNPYDISQNKKGAIPDSAMRDNKAMNGASVDRTTSPGVVTQLSPDKLKEAAAKGNQKAQWEIDLQNLDFPLTMADYEYITDDSHSEQEKLSYLYGKLGDGGIDNMTKFREQRDAFNKKYQNNFTALDKLAAEENQYEEISEKVRKIFNDLKRKSTATSDLTAKEPTEEEQQAEVEQNKQVQDERVSAQKPTFTQEERDEIDAALDNAIKAKQAENDAIDKDLKPLMQQKF